MPNQAFSGMISAFRGYMWRKEHYKLNRFPIILLKIWDMGYWAKIWDMGYLAEKIRDMGYLAKNMGYLDPLSPPSFGTT